MTRVTYMDPLDDSSSVVNYNNEITNNLSKFILLNQLITNIHNLSVDQLVITYYFGLSADYIDKCKCSFRILDIFTEANYAIDDDLWKETVVKYREFRKDDKIITCIYTSIDEVLFGDSLSKTQLEDIV